MQKIVAALALVVALTACPHPIGTVKQAVAHVVDCSKEAIVAHGIELIPSVNSCLISMNAVACLLGFVDPAKGIGEDLIACIVRSRGAEFAAAARENSGDELSGRAATAAARFLNERQITFSDGP